MSNTQVHVRKSVYDLSDTEKSNLRTAFELLYSTPSSSEDGATMMYQNKAGILASEGHYQRNDMLFLPWARAYFSDFEKALQNVLPDAHPTITLPYWDYTSERAIEEGIPHLLSDQYYEVVETNAEDDEQLVQKINPLYVAQYDLPLLTFRKKDSDLSLLKSAQKFASFAMKAEDFISFGTEIYLTDVQSHIYIGGSSADTNTAAYDPIFWFTHCQLDHFWFQWQNGPYGNEGIPNSVLNASLKPFKDGGDNYLKTKDVLDTRNLGYTYLE